MATIERGGASRIDVFQAAATLGAFLLFRPLSGLLGAYLGKPDYPTSGIIVSTQRDLHVQRFTAAHEIGHLFLGHTTTSLDDQVGLWRGEVKDLREVAADAFASEFMLPRWLYILHARRHQWATQAFSQPETIYQLSLRMGASYDATCWGLLGHNLLKPGIVDKLREVEPKKLKLATLNGRAPLIDPWADVWLIDENDHGFAFEGGPNDVVIFRCRERASSGYLWDEAQLENLGFELLADEREAPDSEILGGETTRILVTRVREPNEYKVLFADRRPWNPEDSSAQLSLALDLHGKELGLPRFARKATIEA
ncbi:MAG: ImmA/IrrE family metallo-endopeptidase [Polyangiaceae bacterium]